MAEPHIIINIGRQLGSGGRVIGRLLAEEFGCRFYDKELLNLAAKESGFSEQFFAQNDEHKRFFKTLFHLHDQHIGDNNFYTNNFSQESLFQFQADAIRKAANEGSCLFVGRCADYVLRDFKNMISIFITASMDFRISQIMAKQHFAKPQEARRFIEHGESKRAAYYNYYTGKRWGDASGYNLCIDSSELGLMETEKLIADFIRKRLGQ